MPGTLPRRYQEALPRPMEETQCHEQKRRVKVHPLMHPRREVMQLMDITQAQSAELGVAAIST